MAWLWSVNPIVGWSRGSEGVARHTGDGGTGAEIIGSGGIWPSGMCRTEGFFLANPLRHTQKTRRKAGQSSFRIRRDLLGGRGAPDQPGGCSGPPGCAACSRLCKTLPIVAFCDSSDLRVVLTPAGRLRRPICSATCRTRVLPRKPSPPYAKNPA